MWGFRALFNSKGGFPGGSAVKNLPVVQETWVRCLGQEDSPGEENDSPLQFSCLENPMDRGAWRATICEVTMELHTTEQLALCDSV